jgi:unsaturated chondroitin disaccharide hydrolase
MMDSLMNTAFFFWGAENSGEEKYRKAALSQIDITNRLIVREDGSTNHQYQFDPKTKKPMYPVTLQGYSDDSCWSRGQAWGAYGFPIAYSYSGEEYIKELSKNVINYTLNHLLPDLVPNWDYDFVTPFAPRDSSAGVITSCGMLELANNLPDTDPDKAIYKNASARLLEAVIDNCTGNPGVEYDGLIYGVTHAYTINKAHDECAIYGDFFYLEALARHLLPDFVRFW